VCWWFVSRRAAPRFWRCSFDKFTNELYFSAMFAKLRSEISVAVCKFIRVVLQNFDVFGGRCPEEMPKGRTLLLASFRPLKFAE
jgi:hypothetical protein